MDAIDTGGISPRTIAVMGRDEPHRQRGDRWTSVEAADLYVLVAGDLREDRAISRRTIEELMFEAATL